MTRKCFRSLLGGLAVRVLRVTGSSFAQAMPRTQDERAAGLWCADALGVDELQAQGATGAGIKIAVVDIAIKPDAPELAGANYHCQGWVLRVP